MYSQSFDTHSCSQFPIGQPSLAGGLLCLDALVESPQWPRIEGNLLSGNSSNPFSVQTYRPLQKSKVGKQAIKKCLPRKRTNTPRNNTEPLPITADLVKLPDPQEPPVFSPTPGTHSIRSSLDNGLTCEEIQIGSFDLSRWKDLAYTLRVGGIELLVEILHSYSKVNKLRCWYGISRSGGLYERNVLAASEKVMGECFCFR